MRKKFIIYLMLLTSIAVPDVFTEEVYSWRDEKGKLHFGDRPPEKEEKQKVEVEMHDISSPNIADKVKAKRRYYSGKGKKYTAQSGKNVNRAVDPEYCKSSEKEYVNLTTFYHVWYEGRGNRAFPKKVLYDANQKPLSRVEQNKIAESIRAEANTRGCYIRQTSGLKLN